jgi:hypothetical protein
MAHNLDTSALAAFVLDTLDFHPDYEDDAFAFSFEGQRVYCQRKRSHFALEVAGQKIKLPRC